MKGGDSQADAASAAQDWNGSVSGACDFDLETGDRVAGKVLKFGIIDLNQFRGRIWRADVLSPFFTHEPESDEKIQLHPVL